MGRKKYKKDKFSHGIIEFNIKNPDVCSTIGDCCIVDCLKCDNCVHKIIISTGNVSGNSENTERYIIEFFDRVDINDIIGYFDDDTNDYRITREKDGVILRCSKLDLIERDNKYNSIKEEVLSIRANSYNGCSESSQKENSKSFIKRVMGKVSNKTSR